MLRTIIYITAVVNRTNEYHLKIHLTLPLSLYCNECLRIILNLKSTYMLFESTYRSGFINFFFVACVLIYFLFLLNRNYLVLIGKILSWWLIKIENNPLFILNRFWLYYFYRTIFDSIFYSFNLNRILICTIT